MPDTARLIELAAGGLIGASVGAFAATAAIRLADGRNPWRGRSCCDGCGRRLSVLETLPLIGMAAAGGRCRACGAPIDALHLIAEALGAALTLLCLWTHPGWEGALLSGLGLLLLTTSVVDARIFRLLDVFTAPIALLALVWAWRRDQMIEGAAAAAIAGAVLYGLKTALERRRRKPMLGLGDIKLVMALALCLGERTPLMLTCAALAGLALALLLRKRDQPLPFGPFLASSAWLLLMISG